MKRVYLADAQPDERSALHLLLIHLNLQIVGEAADWPSTLALAPATHPDIVLVDWGLLSAEAGTALMDLRMALPGFSCHRAHQLSGRPPAGRPLVGGRCVYQ